MRAPSLPAGKELQNWNIYSPLWAPVSIGAGRSLVLKDEDPYDFAKAERVFPSARKMHAEFSVTPAQADHGELSSRERSIRPGQSRRVFFRRRRGPR